MPALSAPTLPGRQAQVQAPSAAAAKQAAPAIPFTRAARKKSRLAFQVGPLAIGVNQTPLTQQQLPAAGYLRQLRITVDAVSTGNTAAVAFQPDAPYNILQNIGLLSAAGDTLIQTLDGFALAMANKYLAFGTDGAWDQCGDPNFSLVPGTVANGGSFHFEYVIPFEIDSRDAFGAVTNMAANQSFLFSSTLNSLSQVYSTSPTTAPQVTITAVEEFWSAPDSATQQGIPQSTEPLGIGSLSLIQTQTPPIVPSTGQKIMHVNVGNVIRASMYILRNSSGVRTEADWPAVTNFYLNTDPLMYKTKAQWRAQHAREYRLFNGLSATPALGKLDNGVYIVTDFINDGGQGGQKVSCASNRDLYLVTGSSTAFEIEAVNWGSGASTLQIIQNNVRPSSSQAFYAPQTK